MTLADEDTNPILTDNANSRHDICQFLSDPGIPGYTWGPIYGSESLKLTCADLTDVTLADEDTNPILTDNANRAFQCNVAKQVTQAGGKMCN